MYDREPFDPQNGQYEYVFSAGEPAHFTGETPKRKKKKSGFFGGFLVGISVALVLSILAGAAGGFFAWRFLSDGSAGSFLYRDAEVVVQKTSSMPSPYGSAGEDVLLASQVVSAVCDTVVLIDSVKHVSYGYGTTSDVASGSGVIISEDGYLLTCNHVVEGADSVRVTLRSGNVYDAVMIGSDANSDLAVLKINPGSEPLTAARQGCSGDLAVGEAVVAIGNPLGSLSWTVTGGMISATERAVRMSDGTVMTLLQTDAAVNSGNSGGGLFNLRGELIGVVNAKYSKTGVEGLAFAIPIDSAFTVEENLIRYGYVRGIPYAGLQLQEIPRETVRYPAGVYVLSSEFCEELEYADRILSVNGTEIRTVADFKTIVSSSQVGDTLEICVMRNGKEETAHLTLREYVPEGARAGQ